MKLDQLKACSDHLKEEWYRVKLDQLKACSDHFLLSQWTHVKK